ncbi:MAG: type II toxin-antitoxin system VapC family toxin [Solirubrobacteraceae bacterium]
MVLDAWAVLAVLEDEPEADHILALLAVRPARMSSINLGEVYYQAIRRRGRRRADEALQDVRQMVSAELPDHELVLAAGRLKARGKISYADCYAVATAQRHHEPLVTGDPEILALDGEVEVIDPR